MFIQYQLLNSSLHEGSRLVPRPFENGNEASRLFVNLEFQRFRTHLHLLDHYSCLAGFSYSRPISRSVHLLCNAIVNSSWLSRDHVRHIYADSAHTRTFASVTRPFFQFFGRGQGMRLYRLCVCVCVHCEIVGKVIIP